MAKAIDSSDKDVRQMLGGLFTVVAFYTSKAATQTKEVACSVRLAYRLASNHDGTVNDWQPFAYMAETQQNGTYTLKEMLKQSDRRDFAKAMEKEIQDHMDNGHWTMLPRAKMKPRMKTILAIWLLKRKCRPDDSVIKHKARLCAHGGMTQWGVNYWETFSTVVNWVSSRFFLTLAIIHKLSAECIDFTLGFPQAKLDVNV